MELYDVVAKLVGPTDAVGETHEDARRLENLKELTELVYKLIVDISRASNNVVRHEASMRAIGIHAADFLGEIRKMSRRASTKRNVAAIYRKAAEKALLGTAYTFLGYGPEHTAFMKMFITGYLPGTMFSNYSERCLAFCFMAAMVEAGDA